MEKKKSKLSVLRTSEHETKEAEKRHQAQIAQLQEQVMTMMKSQQFNTMPPPSYQKMNMHDRYDSELIMYDQMPANSKSTTPVTKQMMVAGKILHQDLKRFDYNSMIKNSIETSVERTARCSIGSGQGLMSKTIQK